MWTYKKFLNKIYLFQFFGNLMFIYPVYAVMFHDTWLWAWEISFLYAIWSWVAFILEIPSWGWADIYSRKSILIISKVIKAFAFIIQVYRMSFRWFFVWLFLRWISSALTSWSLEAFVYDEMVEYWKEDDYAKVLWRISSISLIAFAVSSFLAMLKEFVSYEFILWMTSLSLIISLLIMFFIKDVKQKKKASNDAYFDTIKIGLWNIRTNKHLLSIVIFLVIFWWSTLLIDEYFPLYLKVYFTFPEWIYWLYFWIGSLLWAAGSYVAHRYKDIPSNILMLLVWLLWSILLFMWLNPVILGLLCWLFFTFLTQFITVLIEAAMQKEIPSSVRATVSSVSWFGKQLLSTIAYLLFWILAVWDNYTFWLSVFWVVIILLWIWGIKYLVFRWK